GERLPPGQAVVARALGRAGGHRGAPGGDQDQRGKPRTSCDPTAPAHAPPAAGGDRVGERELCSREPFAGGAGPSEGPAGLTETGLPSAVSTSMRKPRKRR